MKRAFPRIALDHVSGFTLLELILASALGALLVTAAVQQWRAAQLAQTQLRDRLDAATAGVWALGFLRRSAAAAGYLGCNSASLALGNALNGDWADLSEFNLQRPVEGHDWQGVATSGTTPDLDDWRPPLTTLPRQVGGGARNAMMPGTGIRVEQLVPGSDLLIFRRIQGPGAPLLATTGNNDAIRVAPADDGLDEDVMALMHDCEQGVLFRISDLVATPGGRILRRATGASAYDNRTGANLTPMGRPYAGADNPLGGRVSIVQAEIYFVAPAAAPNLTSLWRRTGTARPAELVEGVADLQVLAGIDADPLMGGDGPDSYVTLDALMPQHRIHSLMLALTLRYGEEVKQLTQTVRLGNRRNWSP